MKVWTRGTAAILLFAAALGGCGRSAAGSAPPAEFRNARRVAIVGYEGSAMEPYISCDGRYLFFNNRNEPAEQTDILFAERSGEETFRYLGALPGVNLPPPVLDAVPSLDARGELFFVSTRSYEQTLSTLYRGDFREGTVSAVSLVPGNVSLRQRGWLTMDAEVSRDGGLLYFANARFTGGPVPVEADLSVARRGPEGFSVAADSRAILAALNSSALEYAPATSADGLELFFTRLQGTTPVILRSTRTDPSAAFSAPQPVAGISGFVEAPTLSCDGEVLYHHRLEGNEFHIVRTERVR